MNRPTIITYILPHNRGPRRFFTLQSSIFALHSLLILLLLTCRPTAPTLEVGIIAPAFNHLPLLLSEQQLKLHRFSSGWELGEALIAGRLDAAIIPFTYVVSAAAQGSPVRILSCLEHEDDGIIARPGIDRVEDLAGRRIGCLKASTIELLLRRTLRDRGITAELVYFASPLEMYAALERGDVDALSSYVPGIFKAEGRAGRIIHWYSTDWPMHPCCDIAVHTGRVRNKAPAVTRFLAGLRAGCDVIARDTVRAVNTAAQTWNLTDDVALQSLRHTPFRVSLTRAEQEFELDIANLMLELDYIERRITAGELYLNR